MGKIVFYDYSIRLIVPLDKYVDHYGGCYMDIESSAAGCLSRNQQNPEWDIQQKITRNEDTHPAVYGGEAVRGIR